MSIKTKIILLVVLVVSISLSIGTTLSYQSAKNFLLKKNYASLESSRDSKSAQIMAFFKERVADINVLSHSQNVKNLILDLNKLDDTLHLSHTKSIPVKNKHFRTLIEPHEDFFTNYVKEYNYYDLFLIDEKDGHVVYTVKKESDFGTNLDTGSLKDSGLGEVYKKVKELKKTTFVDMRRYSVSANKPAMFLGTPVFVDGKVNAILVLQISDISIKKVMQFRVGYGETQESYLVGQDNLMRSDSYLSPDTHSIIASFENPSLGRCDSYATREALSGKAGIKTIIDYNGNRVLSSYAPLKIDDDIDWAIISEIDEDEVLKGIVDLKNTMIVLYMALLLLVAVILYIIIQKVIISRIQHFNKSLLQFFSYLNKETDSIELIDSSSNDEIGKMIRIVNSNIDTAKVIFDEEAKMLHKIEDLNENLEKRVEEELEKNRFKDTLFIQQARLAQIGEMISMIAHQWRQPLSSISVLSISLRMNIELEKFDLEKQDDREKYQESILNTVDSIEEHVMKLTDTIDNFRNFYTQDKEKVFIKLEDIILKTLNIIKPSLDADSIELLTDFNSNSEIEAYDTELLQVILSILKNAQDNFKVKKTKSPLIKIVTENNKVTICDNGGGIPDNIIDKIFDPYFSTKSDKNEVGLGLYMSKMVIEGHHGGKLSVENSDGGACFIIKL